MTMPIGNGGEQAKINVDSLQKMDQQQHSEQQRLDDEAARKINDDKKKRPEDVVGVAASNWHALPREAQKVIEKFAFMVGIQHSLEASIGKADQGDSTDFTESPTALASQSTHDATTQADQPVTPPTFTDHLSGPSLATSVPKEISRNQSDSTIQLPDRIAGAIDLASAAPTSIGGDTLTDDANVHATSAKMERDQRLATLTRQATDQDKSHDVEGGSQVSLPQQVPQEVVIPQQPSPLPQQSSQQRFAKSSAERLAAVTSIEQQPEGLKYNLKSWGGDQSVVVTGTAQSGYQARGSDQHVERILKQHADDSLAVSIESSESSVAAAVKGSGAFSGNGKSVE